MEKILLEIWMILNLTNYENVALDDITTVGALYTQTKLSTLRFYLTAKRAKKTTWLERWYARSP